MRYVTHRPRAPLDAYVEYIWALSAEPAHARERIVPNGTIELVINLEADAFRIFDPSTGDARRLRGAMVSGCYTSAFDFDTSAHANILGVHFKPGTASPLLGAPSGVLANAHVDLEALWGSSALRERLCAEATTQQRIALLERALIARLPDHPHPRGDLAAALVELGRPDASVGRVALAIGLSHRRFIEVFTEEVGLAPKRYAMVRRFQRALEATQRSPRPPWARIAIECGYYDQAHLCRDWLALARVSPGDFVRLGDTRVKASHLALPSGGSILSNTAHCRGRTL